MAELTGRALIASRCAKFFKNGDFVNLGIDVPLMCGNYLPEGVELWLEAEIGTVGSGPSPSWDDVDIDCIDAGGQPASIIPGGSVYDNETSFMFIRGGHIDAAVLGTLQVDQEGSIANWTIPANLFLVWAAPWISVPVSRRLSLQLITARRTVSPRFLRNVHCL